jgi:ATP-dependent DNA helicase RecG
VTVKDEECPIEAQKVTVKREERSIDMEKIVESLEKLPIKEADATESSKKLPIKESMVSESSEKLPIKISMGAYTDSYRDKGYSEPIILSLMAIYNDIEVNQVFGSAYFMKILECSESTARRLLAKLKEMNVVIEVAGIGKGRGKGNGRGIYRFKYESEV